MNFLAVGVELLPILWIALAVETTTLQTAFRAPATRQNRADPQSPSPGNYPFGAVAEFVALAALFNDQRVLVAVAAYLLFAALGFRLGVATVGLHRAMTQPED